jgi:hypothetical protein
MKFLMSPQHRLHSQVKMLEVQRLFHVSEEHGRSTAGPSH